MAENDLGWPSKAKKWTYLVINIHFTSENGHFRQNGDFRQKWPFLANMVIFGKNCHFRQKDHFYQKWLCSAKMPIFGYFNFYILQPCRKLPKMTLNDLKSSFFDLAGHSRSFFNGSFQREWAVNRLRRAIKYKLVVNHKFFLWFFLMSLVC